MTYRVTGARKRDTAISSKRALRLKPAGTGVLAPDDFGRLHIHHIDPNARSILWCDVADQDAVSQAPFYYQGIRAQATTAYEVGFEHLEYWQRPLAAQPVFVFSIGRCGSTLFSQICAAAGLRTWSEPDTFTNLAMEKGLRERPSEFRSLARVALNDLADKAAAAGHTAFGVKMRAHVTTICEDLSSHHPKAVNVFLVRDPIDWAKSVHRTFGQTPVRIARHLTNMMADMRLARARGLPIQLLDYADLVSDPQSQARRVASLVGLPEPDSIHLNAIMNRDSQEGTSIARGTGHKIADTFEARFVKAASEKAPWLFDRAPADWLD